jgi:hypothetical protein
VDGRPTRGQVVELFSHPVCSGCREAALELGRLAEAGLIELVTHSLAVPAGRRRARELGVDSVPTALVGGRTVGLDTRAALDDLIASLRSTR